MKEVSCYLCGSKEAIVIFEQSFKDLYLELINSDYNKIQRAWKICTVCGFIYRCPALTLKDQKILYSKYRDTNFRKELPDEYFNRITSLPPEKSENHHKLSWLFKELNQLRVFNKQSPKKVLDIGCGGGVLLHSVRKFFKNASLSGVEPNKPYADLAARRLGIDVVNKYYANGLFLDKFDLILCADVLEHVNDTRAFISALAGDMKDNAMLFLEIPGLEDFKTQSQNDEHFLCPHHYYFSVDTLGYFLSEQNIRIVAIEKVLSLRKRNALRVVAVKDPNFAPLKKPRSNHAEFLRNVEARKLG